MARPDSLAAAGARRRAGGPTPPATLRMTDGWMAYHPRCRPQWQRKPVGAAAEREVRVLAVPGPGSFRGSSRALPPTGRCMSQATRQRLLLRLLLQPLRAAPLVVLGPWVRRRPAAIQHVPSARSRGGACEGGCGSYYVGAEPRRGAAQRYCAAALACGTLALALRGGAWPSAAAAADAASSMGYGYR